ncbi:CWF19-like protein 2 [Panonychus citri]|uniref:CWF19-like protein 2 n=1 Tax=Panonychus citri TaxID=50023 RepID=UPI002307924D|nr:CWF19-like protein 2 [Panonychus citri]
MDANTLSAKIIKAEMLGDMDRVEELKKQLDQLTKQLPESFKSTNNQRGRDNHNPNYHHQHHHRNHNRPKDSGNTNELNKLNAKIIKAELMGNQDLIQELKSQLEKLKKSSDVQQSNQPSKSDQQVNQNSPDNLNKLTAQLMKAEMMGDLQRVAELRKQLGFNEDDNSDHDEDLIVTQGSQLGPTNEPTRNAKLNQIAKKMSSDRLGLKQMFVSAKRGDVEDEAKLFIASSSKLINMDDEYEDVVRKGNKKRKQEDREDRPKIIPDEPEEIECGHCVQKVPRRLVIDKKSTVYLCLPPHEPFVDGHCYIRSVNHVRCSVEAEEDCITQIAELRQQLCLQAKAQKKSVVFIEMYLKKGRNKHFQIECFPIKKKYLSDCKMYFKKAILECEMEWSMNKKLVEIKDKCITKSIPKGLSYFWVSFGPTNDSFGHVIEEEQYFPKHFGYEVISGLLDIDRFKYTKPRPESYEQQVERANKFRAIWNQSTIDEQSTDSEIMKT